MLSLDNKHDPLNRSIVHGLELIGEGWSMLIIRVAFSARGLPLRTLDIVIVAGPGASQETNKRIDELNWVSETDE
jgi:hypothetical protein